jgi:hypothetical protein
MLISQWIQRTFTLVIQKKVDIHFEPKLGAALLDVSYGKTMIGFLQRSCRTACIRHTTEIQILGIHRA